MSISVIEVEYIIHKYFLHLSHVYILSFPTLLLFTLDHLFEFLKIEELFYCLNWNPQTNKSIFQGLANIYDFTTVYFSWFCSLLCMPFISCYLGTFLILILFLCYIDTSGHYLTNVLVVIVISWPLSAFSHDTFSIIVLLVGIEILLFTWVVLDHCRTHRVL